MSTVASEHRAVEFMAKAQCPNLACEESGKPPYEMLAVATVIDERFVTYTLPTIRCLRCHQWCAVDGYDVVITGKDKRL